MERVAEVLRELPPVDPAARARLSEALRREREAPRTGNRIGPVMPRTLRWWWPLGLAAAAGVAGFAVRGWISAPAAAPAPVAAAPSPALVRQVAAPGEYGGRVVQFTLVAPGASSVAVAGDFNGWNAGQTPMSRVSGGDVWVATMPLPPGQHTYAFVVNGREWRADPQAPRATEDEFGTPKSIVLIGGGTP
ncbi:MAG TPA: isoamylase early set domain-containing protein [Gemmatimonadales bacterium]|jgi:hypothetical protein|nr:isoamylase early set domain-containing protein [Gemmatimonadales bacterium]